eukprot:SAG11_NODE_64_length_18817_cov_64.238327_13_plen_85_part_00
MGGTQSVTQHLEGIQICLSNSAILIMHCHDCEQHMTDSKRDSIRSMESRHDHIMSGGGQRLRTDSAVLEGTGRTEYCEPRDEEG